MKKSVVKRFVLKGETLRTLQNIELSQVAGGITGDACPRSMDPEHPCDCSDVKSTCNTTVQDP